MRSCILISQKRAYSIRRRARAPPRSIHRLTNPTHQPTPDTPTDKAPATDGGGEVTERVITVADSAITHLKELKAKQGVDHLWLRMGVRSGGCSVSAYVGG